MATSKLSNEDVVYQLRISLAESKPKIWRVIQISANSTMSRLHKAIQSAFDWEDSHLYEFRTEIDEKVGKSRKLKDIFSIVDKIVYTYDFGDCWKHLIAVESILVPDLDSRYPRCIAGKNHAPFEDIGGIYGYRDILDALKDKNHPEYEYYMEILENEIGTRDFDPRYFDLKDIKF